MNAWQEYKKKVDEKVSEQKIDEPQPVIEPVNEFVPAFMLIENPESEKPLTELFAPDRDFEDIDQGLNIIKEFYER